MRKRGCRPTGETAASGHQLQSRGALWHDSDECSRKQYTGVFQAALIISKETHQRISQVAQMVKNLPAMQETWVRSLGQEDPPGEGNGSPLQYSCLENPTDRGALTGYSPWGRKDTTEWLTVSLFRCMRLKT